MSELWTGNTKFFQFFTSSEGATLTCGPDIVLQTGLTASQAERLASLANDILNKRVLAALNAERARADDALVVLGSAQTEAETLRVRLREAEAERDRLQFLQRLFQRALAGKTAGG